MVQRIPLDRAFAALADETRRGILERLGEGPATIGGLAEPTGMTLTGIRKHVDVLVDAGLVTTEKVGRTRQCRLGPERLDEAIAWIDSYRRLQERSLERPGTYLTLRDAEEAEAAQAARGAESADRIDDAGEH